ncbi:MAG TPA: lipopolysaccharide kinase InaA family protein [Candidatus Hydrogenedentes bacterium]|nr:lipopolysaccharide kinase InaA family protein [Candidatus Hydrogenedentota bacterium]
MNPLLCDESISLIRRRGRRIYLTRRLSLGELEDIVSAPGETLKCSSKAMVTRTGKWVVKQSRGHWLIEVIRHTARRSRYRRAWIAAHHLRRHDVLAPVPVAFIEFGVLGLLTGNLMVSEYLEDCANVELYLKNRVETGIEKDELGVFFERLAYAVNRFAASGACHEDLSGKNIFTQNGERFYFIDLDAVAVGRPITDAQRLANLIQLYDSFCDFVQDDLLEAFIGHMVPSEGSLQEWFGRVREGQRIRRGLYQQRRGK